MTTYCLAVFFFCMVSWEMSTSCPGAPPAMAWTEVSLNNNNNNIYYKGDRCPPPVQELHRPWLERSVWTTTTTSIIKLRDVHPMSRSSTDHGLNSLNNRSIIKLRDVHFLSRSSTDHGLNSLNNRSIIKLRDVHLLSRDTAGLQSSSQCNPQRSIINTVCIFKGKIT